MRYLVLLFVLCFCFGCSDTVDPIDAMDASVDVIEETMPDLGADFDVVDHEPPEADAAAIDAESMDAEPDVEPDS
jgi:hypothetical protein